MFKSAKQRLAGAAIVVTLVAGGAATALAATSTPPPSNGTAVGTGINEFGMTAAYYDHHTLDFTYTKGFFCDTSVAAKSSTRLRGRPDVQQAAGTELRPAVHHRAARLHVPMNMQQCPTTLVCVDHPGTVDLTRLESALKPLYPKLTDAQLTAALQNFAVPGHDHFITDTNNFQPEWWDVQVVGVTSPTDLRGDPSTTARSSYIQQLLNNHDANVVGPIPSNLFLFFAVDHQSHHDDDSH